MFRLVIPAVETYDEIKQEFSTSKEKVLQLEHSLVSISKWEAKWHKPFLSDKDKTVEEFINYIRCMTLTQNVPEDTYNNIGLEQITEVSRYIEEPMTATTISNREVNHGPKQILTAEVIYSQMIALGIPFECRKWHLNRLLMLINVCAIKNKPLKYMSKRESAQYQASINKARRRKLHTKG